MSIEHSSFRSRLHEIIFEADTPAGKAFDVPLLILIILSVIAVMIMGYGIIAVPTGIVSVELAGVARKQISTQACPQCGAEGHDADAVHCKYCGETL